MLFNPFIFYNPFWWVALPGLLLGFYAQFRLSSTHRKYSGEPIQCGLSGAEAAREILDRAGLTNVPIQEIPGVLTDHYDPARRALFLSSDSFHGRTVAAVGVAAHEAGHALQQQSASVLFSLRMWLAPVAPFASYAFVGIFMVGYLLGTALFSKVLLVAITLFAVYTLFQIVTLPVEYDASHRAKQQLVKLGLVQPNEAAGVNSMLNAAALTYVAAMLTAVLQLLELIMLFNRNNRRD